MAASYRTSLTGSSESILQFCDLDGLYGTQDLHSIRQRRNIVRAAEVRASKGGIDFGCQSGWLGLLCAETNNGMP